MAFELNTLALKDTTELHLTHPVTDEKLYADEDKKLPVVAILYGTSSKQYRNAITALQNRQLNLGKKKVSAEKMREESVEILVQCSEQIKNLTLDGEPVNNPEAFRKLYSDPAYEWLKSQIDSVIGDVAAFLS